MKISVSSSYDHQTPCKNTIGKDPEVMRKMLFEAASKIGLDEKSIVVDEFGHLELRESNSLKLHTLTLEMEKLGYDLRLTKKTIIEIC